MYISGDGISHTSTPSLSSDMSAARHADVLFVKDRKDNGEFPVRTELHQVSLVADSIFSPLFRSQNILRQAPNQVHSFQGLDRGQGCGREGE
jgi:hypothetical protein